MVTIIVNNTRCKIINLNDQNISKELDAKLSYAVQGFEFMRTRNNWDGRHRLITSTNTFPIGMLNAVKEIFNKFDQPFTIQDNREKIVYGKPIEPLTKSKFKTREYQDNAISSCIKHGSGIIRMSTGAGKSFIIASVVAHFNVKAIIYVVSIDLLYQMVDTLRDSFGIEAGIIGDGKCEIKDINVMTIWSAGSAFERKLDQSNAEDITLSKKRVDNRAEIRRLVQSAELMVLDECQYAGSDTFQFLSKESASAYHRFLFSGTPWRESGDDILLEATAGRKIVDIDASFLIRKGYLVKPHIVFKKVPPMRGVGKTYHQVYSNYITNNDTRNNMAISACKNFNKKGLKTLILIRNINHGEVISKRLTEEGIDHLFLSGKDDSKKREDGIQRIKSGDVMVVIASTIFDIGIDIPSLDSLINLGGGKSTGKMLQRIGRAIRSHPGKTKAFIVDFDDQCKYLRDHSKVRKKTAMSEPEFDVRSVD